MDKRLAINKVSKSLLDPEMLDAQFLNTGTIYLFNDFETGKGRELRQEFLESVPIDQNSKVVTDEATLLLSDPSVVRTRLVSDLSDSEAVSLVAQKIIDDSILSQATGGELLDDYANEVDDLIQELVVGLYYEGRYKYELDFIFDNDEFAELVADNLHDKVIEPSVEILTAHLHERLGRRSFQKEIKNELTTSEKATLIEFTELVDQLEDSEFAKTAIASGLIDRTDLHSRTFIDSYVDSIDFRFIPNTLLLDVGQYLYDELLQKEKLALIDLSNDQDPFDLDNLSYLDAVLPTILHQSEKYNFEIIDINIDPVELTEW